MNTFIWRVFLDQNSKSYLALLHLYTTFHWCKSTSRRRGIFTVDSASWSDLISWKLVRCNALASFSQVSVKHRAAEFEKSLFIWESRRSLSVLLGSERRFNWWMLGNGVLNHVAFDQRYGSAKYNVQQNVRIIKIRHKILWCVLPNVQQFIPGKTDRVWETENRKN